MQKTHYNLITFIIEGSFFYVDRHTIHHQPGNSHQEHGEKMATR